MRDALGVSHQPAPEGREALRAAHALDQILDDATNGRLRLMIFDVGLGEQHSPIEAMTRFRGEV